jgi:hypothetical protein
LEGPRHYATHLVGDAIGDKLKAIVYIEQLEDLKLRAGNSKDERV